MERLLTKPAFFFGTAAVLIGVAVGAVVYDQNQWDAFAAEHECKVVGQIAGHNAYGYHNGKYQMYWVPSKKTYLCNDGVEYTR